MKQKVLIITATDKELSALELPENCDTHICGIGLCRSAVEIMWALEHYKPSLAIMLGIAGRYKCSDLKIGDSVLVSQEIVADMGAFTGQAFMPLAAKEYECDLACRYGFTTVRSASVNACAADFICPDAEIENMEGASFFAAAIKLKVPFIELRTISNTVTPARDDWNLELALKNMNLALKTLLNALES